MKDKILIEITNFCEECPSHEYCSEEECVLFRVEKIILKKGGNQKNEISNKRNRKKI